MPEYLSPGVYIEEISGPRSIEGVSTSTAAFLGRTERGPEYPLLVGSWLEYQRWFGGYNVPAQPAGSLGGATATSYLPYAVQGFFDNGGQRLYIARIISTDAVAAQNTLGDLNLIAFGRGTWGNRIVMQVLPSSQVGGGRFALALGYYADAVPDLAGVTNITTMKREAGKPRPPDLVEFYDNLVISPAATNGVISTLNTASHLVRVWFTKANPAGFDVNNPPPLTKLGDGAAGSDSAGPIAINQATYEGSIGPLSNDPNLRDLLGYGTGLSALDAIKDISLLAIPDQALLNDQDPTLTDLIINHCEEEKDRFGILSAWQQVANTSTLVPPRDSSWGAFYFPWIQIYDPVSNGPVIVPPTGHIAGLIARTDIERGVHKAPANEVVNDARNLQFPVPKSVQDVLNPKGVNCIRDFRPDGRGIRLWGARTMSSDPEWKYVNVRRLFIFMEQSILRGTQWVVFEPNDYSLWAQVKRTITGFLTTVWRSGALMGLTQDEAFFVKCDRTTMTQDDIDNGRLICYIGVAPVKPAEFVIFRIQQKTLDAQQ
jgi:uncharacterized protein